MIHSNEAIVSLYNELGSRRDLRSAFEPYLTDQEDPYFDIFLAIVCASFPEQTIRHALQKNQIDSLFKKMRQSTICEIGKGAYSKSFRTFGKNYLAFTEPYDPRYPDAPSLEAYEGTFYTEHPVDLSSFSHHSLSGKNFDITLSNSFLGNPLETHLIAGRPFPFSRSSFTLEHSLMPMRNMLGVFSNITKKNGLSVHRCDRELFKYLTQERYLLCVGFSLEALLRPFIRGGFIEDEVIVALRKTHYSLLKSKKRFSVGYTQMLDIKDNLCILSDENFSRTD